MLPLLYLHWFVWMKLSVPIDVILFTQTIYELLHWDLRVVENKRSTSVAGGSCRFDIGQMNLATRHGYVTTSIIYCGVKLLIYHPTSTMQRCNRWSLGMDKQFYPTLYRVCDNLIMLWFKLNHVSKKGPGVIPVKQPQVCGKNRPVTKTHKNTTNEILCIRL